MKKSIVIPIVTFVMGMFIGNAIAIIPPEKPNLTTNLLDKQAGDGNSIAFNTNMESSSYQKPRIDGRQSQKYVDQAMSYLGQCTGWKSKQGCMEEQDKFIRQYVNALAGDYKAQKQIIFDFMLPDEEEGPIITNKIQACAWSQVLSSGGSPYLTKQDLSMMKIDCSDLRDMDLEASRIRAHAITQVIATGLVHRLPVPEIEYDPASGKDETAADQE